MLEGIIFVGTLVVVGGITRALLTKKGYSEQYYKYLMDNKQPPRSPKDDYRYL